MYETLDDIQHLQMLLDRSIEQAGVFLRESFEMPDHSLSAWQLVHLWQGLQTVAFATATKKGDPLVAPIGALLLHGRFYIPTVASALRTRHVLHRASISFTFYQDNDIAVIVHDICEASQTLRSQEQALARCIKGFSKLLMVLSRIAAGTVDLPLQVGEYSVLDIIHLEKVEDTTWHFNFPTRRRHLASA
jgi:hypothetical protein